MSTLHAEDVAAAIDATARQLPQLRIVTAPNCQGMAWWVDSAACTIYIQDDVTPGEWTSSLLDALAVLAHEHGLPSPGRLRLVHGPVVGLGECFQAGEDVNWL